MTKPHTYSLQKSFKVELEWLQQLDITVHIGVEVAEWCNSFVLVQKPNGEL